jgi:2,3-bisphosphoglycerate-independent phosphoglycerate mutase
MQINHQSRQDAVRQQQPLSEEECLKAIDALADAQIRIAQLEKEYLEKFKKILPASKILAIQRAEDQFNSELVKEMQRSRPNIPATNRPSANMPQGNRPPAARQ